MTTIRLDLEPEDADALREVLASDLSELGYEIANTDGHDFKEKLKAKQRFLRRILERLGA
jgi:hypothetical protein